MKTILSGCLTTSIITFIILHFYTYFSPHPLLLNLLSASGVGIFLFAVMRMTPAKIKMPLSLFLIGLLILILTDSQLLNGIFKGVLQMRNMIGLLVIVPMISWVLREEPYLESIMGFAHSFLDSSRKFYFGMISFTQVIAYFLLFGAITMMYQFVNMILKDEKGEGWENYKGTALLRGFSLSVLWVVSIPSFAFVVEVMGASLGLSILQGFAVSLFGCLIALLFSKFEERKYGVDFTAGLQKEIEEILSYTSNKRMMHRNVLEFILLFITLFGTIFVLSSFLAIELLVLIPLVVMIWIILYFLIKKRMYKLLSITKQYIAKDIAGQSYQLCIMLGAGTLIFALGKTDFATIVVNGIYSMQNLLPFLNVLYFLPLMVILLGFAGLGPLTVMVLVAGILEAIHLPYAPELIVLAITLGSSISILLSPVIMPIIVLSSGNGLSGFKNGIQFNWKFAVALYVAVMIYIQAAVYLL